MTECRVNFAGKSKSPAGLSPCKGRGRKAGRNYSDSGLLARNVEIIVLEVKEQGIKTRALFY